MPRRKRILKRRAVGPDSVYRNILVSKFINSLMYSGKKSCAERIFYGALKRLEDSTKTPAVDSFIAALNNVKPDVEIKSRRVGGATYQVPVEVMPNRRESLAIRWLINSSRERNKHGMEEALASELIDAFNSTGGAVKHKEDIHKMADANKAFAHYRW